MKNFFLTVIVFLFTIPMALANDTTIENLVQNPGNYEHERVTFEGHVTRYVQGTATTSSYYEIQGDYGGRIRVNTTDQQPEILKRYAVSGTLTIHNNSPLIIERGKRMLEDAPTLPQQDVIGAGGVTAAEEGSWWEQNMLYVLLVAGAIVLITIIVYVLRYTSQPSGQKNVEAKTDSTEGKESWQAQPTMSSSTQYKTIRMAVDPPKTMSFMPGSLEVISGEDKGKSFKMVGYPTEKGSVITIGRETVLGEEGYSHIQLKDQTVSRKQAEIIYKDGKLSIKNLSETNLTEVDGRKLKPNESVELNPGSTIKAGAIGFKYAS